MNLRSSEFCEEKNQSKEEIYLTSTLKETIVIWSTKGQGILKRWKLVLKPLTISFFLLQHSWSFSSITQIWDLSTISHRRILRPKILNPYSPSFNSFGDKNTKKWVKMETFTPLAKILHCRRQWRQWQISPLQLRKHILRWHCWRSVRNIAFLFFWY